MKKKTAKKKVVVKKKTRKTSVPRKKAIKKPARKLGIKSRKKAREKKVVVKKKMRKTSVPRKKAIKKPARKLGIKSRKKAREKSKKTLQDIGVEREVAKLWQEYKKSKDEIVRDRLVLQYSPLVKYVAGRISARLPHSVDIADLISYGMFGLIDAVKKFDIERGVKFETYAISRIRGAIIDELRRLDWVPRSVRLKARKLEEAYAELLTQFKRSPTDQELAKKLKIDQHELDDLLNQISRTAIMALDGVRAQDSEGAEEQLGLTDVLESVATKDPSEVMENEEAKEVLAQAVRELPEREKDVVALYYYRSLNLKEIAQVLELTESRVSQLHVKALFRLRMELKSKKKALHLI